MRTLISSRVTSRALIALLCAFALAACGDDTDDGEATDASNATSGASNSTTGGGSNTATTAGTTSDTTTGATTSDTTGDDFEDYFEDDLYMLPDSHANVVRVIDFVGEAGGVVAGFDLDHTVSEAGDPESCGHGDLVSPEGVEGIDNQFGVIWPAIEPIIGEQVRGLLQGAINEGRVLVVFELEGVDSLVNDDEVTIHVARGRLDPQIGTSGLIAPDQSFYVDYDHPVSSSANASIVDGELIAGPVEVNLPVDILDARFTMRFPEAVIRATIQDDGSISGHLGGALNIPEVLTELRDTGGRREVELVAPVFETNTDLNKGPNGDCTHMSVAIAFEATTAFLIRDASAE